MQKINGFEDLEAWKASREVRVWIMRITKTIPPYENRDLIDNMRRAARSATRNIAEGFGRFHHKENIQFCRISRGSLTELLDDLITSLDEGYINKETYEYGKSKIARAIHILNGYIRYLSSL